MAISAQLRQLITAFSIAGVGLTVTLTVSCDSDGGGVVDPGGVPEPSYEIADGSAVGSEGFEDVNPHFFFLPPLVPNPTTSGVFDGGVEVAVDALDNVMAIAAATATNRSSMGQDVDAQRATEIDAINGYIVRRAEELGMEVPVNLTLIRLIKTLQGQYTDTGNT